MPSASKLARLPFPPDPLGQGRASDARAHPLVLKERLGAPATSWKLQRSRQALKGQALEGGLSTSGGAQDGGPAAGAPGAAPHSPPAARAMTPRALMAMARAEAFRQAAQAGALLHPSLPLSPAETAKMKRSGTEWSDAEVRQYYVSLDRGIGALNAQWESQGVPLAERARRAFDIRHGARLICRAMLKDQEYVKNELHPRDLKKYGRKDGPTFRQLLEVSRQAGLSEAQAYETIVASAHRTDRDKDLRHGVTWGLGSHTGALPPAPPGEPP